MHQRKMLMHEESDGFIALPGGIGTFEEILEAYTWSQLGYHSKPVALLNTEDYYGFLLKQLHHSVSEGFFKESHLGTLVVDEKADRLIDKIVITSYSIHYTKLYDLRTFLDELKTNPSFMDNVTKWEIRPSSSGQFAPLPESLPEVVSRALTGRGIP